MINKQILAIIILPLVIAAIIYGINAKKNNSNSAQLNINQAKASTDKIKEFNIIAKQWSFEPAEIIVNQGDKVKLNLTSVDVPHSLAINEFGINQFIKPGETAVVEFTADKLGEFTFYCNVFCGQGHQEQTGRLIVQ